MMVAASLLDNRIEVGFADGHSGLISFTDLFEVKERAAYITALDLPGGLLVYAKGEAENRVYSVRHTGKAIEVASLDLCGRLEDILVDVGRLAGRVRALRDEALSLPSVA